MFLGTNKDQKIIFKKIFKEVGKKDLTFDEFSSLYIGNLIFLYIDTYGIPEESAKEYILGGFNAHSNASSTRSRN